MDWNSFRFIDLFAGIGGIRLGFESVGGHCVFSSEFDEDACKTYEANFGEHPSGDITKIDAKDIPDFEILLGGFPCQAFSIIGKKEGFANETCGTLFFDIERILKEKQPPAFMLENVRNLTAHDNGNTFRIIKEHLEKLGYHVYAKVLNALDYGVPQKRERLITVGIRNDLVGKVSFSFPKEHDYKPVLRDVLLDCPEGPGVPYGENKRKIFELVPPGGYWRDIDPEIAKAYMKSCWDMEGGRTGILRRMSLDEPSLTVLTSPSQKQTERCHPLEARPFTVRENARCQTFPDEWQFCGSVQSQYKQVGNAVPVNLAYEIGLEIHKSLEGVK